MGWTGQTSASECPHINGEDHRCDGRLTLRRLDEAFSHCLGTFHLCPAYQHLSWEQQDRESQSPYPPERLARPRDAAAPSAARRPATPLRSLLPSIANQSAGGRPAAES